MKKKKGSSELFKMESLSFNKISIPNVKSRKNWNTEIEKHCNIF